MSLMSSSVYIVYLLIRPLLKRFFSVRLRLNILKIALIYSLLPFPLLKISYVNFIGHFYDIKLYNETTYPLKNSKIVLPNNITIYPKDFYVMAILSGIGLLIACILFIYKQKRYKDFRKNIVSFCNGYENSYIKTVFEETKKEYHIKRKVSILNSDFLKPMTVGMLKPKVILSDNQLSEQQTEHIIKHELMHIKRMDYFYKILLLFATALHWFNPFIHLLSKEIDKLLEYCTDEAVVLKMNEEERKNYGLTIISMGAIKPNISNSNFMPISFFGSNSEKRIKERLNEMKNVKSHKMLNHIAYIFILLSVFILNSSLILAYDEYPTTYKNEYDENTESYFTTDPTFMAEPGCMDEVSRLFSQNINSVFIDSSGIVYPIYEDADAGTDATCTHTYVSGTVQEHKKNSDGSCILKVYNAQRCTKCGNVVLGSLISSTKYTTCPH